MRTAAPKPYLAYYPAIWNQSVLEEKAHFINAAGQVTSSHPAGHPPAYEPLSHRDSYDTSTPPVPAFAGPTRSIRLGDIALARSGDKGSNLNVGIFVRTAKQWDWLRSYLSRAQVRRLLGPGVERDSVYRIERVELPGIFAVHFVLYGLLGRGVSSSTRLDAFGKGFADYFRDKLVEVPEEVLRET